MAPTTTFQFDTDTLLAPIAADSPAGESLQFADIYDRIREAQREDDPNLNRGVWTFALKRADWLEVERLCVETLRTRAKDLQVASALVNAWVHRHGFAGLREGLHVVAGIVNGFSDQLFPQGSDDLEYRLSPLEWLNEKLPLRLKLVPITNPPGEDSQPCSYSLFEAAAHPRSKTNTQDLQQTFQHSTILTSTEHFIEVFHQLEGGMAALETLEAALEQKLGPDAPSLRQLWSALESIRNLVAEILGQRDTAVEAWTPGPSPATLASTRSESEDPGAAVFSRRPIRSRDEAYQVLAEVADYLARTEPHSPAPYLVRRAVTWGTMSLETLLPELVRNGTELQEILRLLQIPMPGK
jgi:type VI secretion system protein ImpA